MPTEDTVIPSNLQPSVGGAGTDSSDAGHYRKLFEQASDGILVVDGNGVCREVNDAGARMLGMAPGEIVGRPASDLIAPEDVPRFAVAFQRVREGEALVHERLLRRKDGASFPVEVSVKQISDGRIEAILHDITGRNRAEAILRESEVRLALVFENAYDPIALYRVEETGGYRLLMINPAYLRLASLRVGRTVSAEEVLDHSYDDLARRVLMLEEAAIRAGREHMDEAVRTGRIVHWEETQRRPIGEVGSERIEIPVNDGRGRFGHVVRVVHDVTERKRTERERAALLERVRCQSDALLKLSLDPAVTGGDVPAAARQITGIATRVAGAERSSIWLLEPDGTTLRCVDRYDAILDRHDADLTIDMSKFPAALDDLANGRTIVLDEIKLNPSLFPVVRDVAQADDLRSALATSIRVGGKVIGAVWIATVGRSKKWRPDEIAFGGALGDHMAQAVLNAERERSARSLRELAGQLMRTQDEERRRIGRDLHDSTGQLLAVLEINMAMLGRTAAGLDARAQALLQECIAQAGQCAASIRTTSYLLHPPLLDEMGLVSAIQWQMDGFRRRSGIKVDAELPAEVLRLQPEDELSLFRVLQEALTNAHRHSGATWVRVRLEQPPGEAILTVSDNGKGIPAAELAFFHRGGTGLGVGLAGMRERLHQLGGRLEVESDSTGTVLRARLPIRKRVPAAVHPPGGES
ncbi:MAG: PAS domain S-box protein [Opitutaceae bacterium]|jgi:PAS domain S-box-containing protein